ncbi:radical SAM protein [Thermoguttaceae bacterium LCP21S3_D4]
MDKYRKEVINVLAKFVPRKTIFFDVIVTEHCNLNCKGCGSFCPISEEEYIDICELERDYARLAKLTDGVMHHINLLGGEPLLHKNIEKIMQLTRKYFPVGIINLVTNAILLDKMDESFWETCRTQNICICPTKYPVKIDYDFLEKKAKEREVEYRYFDDMTEGGWTHKVMDLKGSRYENCSFMYCVNANLCPVLKHGKLYPCPTVAHINKFNKAFGVDLKVCQGDYIDIYKVKKQEKIMKFFAEPIPFCRYCNTPGLRKEEWGISQRSISEWT